MSSSNCCFLTCIQISQEAGQVVCIPISLRIFHSFFVIHTVKGFFIIYKAEADVFLEPSCFLDDPTYIGNLISGSSAFSKSNLNIWSSWFMYCWSLTWGILSITLLACEMKIWLSESFRPMTPPGLTSNGVFVVAAVGLFWVQEEAGKENRMQATLFSDLESKWSR